MKSKIKFISIFLIASGIYVLYRSNEVRENVNIIEKGILQSAIVKNRNQKNLSIRYSYNINNKEFFKTEKTDKQTFINYVSGDRILIYTNKNNPSQSIIKTNNVPISLIKLNFGASAKMWEVSYWYGVVLGVLMLGFGIFKTITGIKNTEKIF